MGQSADSDLAVQSSLLWGDASSARRFDVVLLGAGFDGRSASAAFQQEARRISRALVTTQPFGRLRQLVRLYRIDADLTSVGDPHIESALLDDRLITVDEDLTLGLAHRQVPSADLVLVVANVPQYGGSATRVAVTTRHPQAARLLMHEIGHVAFDLADEYGHGGDVHPGPEPTRVNVTLESDPTRCKWSDLVRPGGRVGCFEGADRYQRGVYRPEALCLMRSVHAPFCVVCSRQVSRRLLAHPRYHPV